MEIAGTGQEDAEVRGHERIGVCRQRVMRLQAAPAEGDHQVPAACIRSDGDVTAAAYAKISAAIEREAGGIRPGSDLRPTHHDGASGYHGDGAAHTGVASFQLAEACLGQRGRGKREADKDFAEHWKEFSVNRFLVDSS